jgi:hypothetical protein
MLDKGMMEVKECQENVTLLMNDPCAIFYTYYNRWIGITLMLKRGIEKIIPWDIVVKGTTNLF